MQKKKRKKRGVTVMRKRAHKAVYMHAPLHVFRDAPTRTHIRTHTTYTDRQTIHTQVTPRRTTPTQACACTHVHMHCDMHVHRKVPHPGRQKNHALWLSFDLTKGLTLRHLLNASICWEVHFGGRHPSWRMFDSCHVSYSEFKAKNFDWM